MVLKSRWEAMKTPFNQFVSALVLSATTLLGMPAFAVIELAPHRAVYDMVLYSAERGSGISGARGKMIYSFRDGCDGWSSETSVKLRLLYAEGDQVVTEWAFASWEAKDGKSYQFRTRQDRNGDTIENLKGKVERTAGGAAATAVFSEPEDTTIELPEGTLFPTRHLSDAFQAHKDGKIIFNGKVFDGASLDNPYEINVVMSRRTALGDSGRAEALDRMIDKAGFANAQTAHYRLAFFNLGSRTEEPEFELGVDYRSDGIARFIRQDFGDFIIDLFLEEVEALKKASC